MSIVKKSFICFPMRPTFSGYNFKTKMLKNKTYTLRYYKTWNNVKLNSRRTHNMSKACNINEDPLSSKRSKDCMHGSITDMIFSSIKIIPSTESLNWGKTHFSLLNLREIKRVKLTCNYGISYIWMVSMSNLMLYV